MFEFTYLVSSILALNFFLWKDWSFFFFELHGTFKAIFGTLDGFPKGIGSRGWVWNGFHGVHSAHQRPIDQNYTNLDLSFGETFEFADLVPNFEWCFMMDLFSAFWQWTFFQRNDVSFFLNFVELLKRFLAPWMGFQKGLGHLDESEMVSMRFILPINIQ